MNVQDALWKLRALGDSSVLDRDSRTGANLAADVLNTVRNLVDIGSTESLASISAAVRRLSDKAGVGE